jgi:hypothetical protein
LRQLPHDRADGNPAELSLEIPDFPEAEKELSCFPAELDRDCHIVAFPKGGAPSRPAARVSS